MKITDKKNMSNAAYDEEYLKMHKELDQYFIQIYFQNEEKRQLSTNITAIIKNYQALENDIRYLSGADVVFLKDEKKIYEYRCYDNSAAFYKLIHHSNGKDYILFRRDLYGYSVLELSTVKDFHYYPKCHLKTEGDETFIWCDPIYNSNNNLMAVFGCYWACPYDLAIVDFSEPFSPVENQVCITFKKEIGDIETYSWKKNSLLINSKHSKLKKGQDGIYVEVNTASTNRIHKFSEALCRKWLEEGNYE